MSNAEKERLLTRDFDDLWVDLWGGGVGIQYRGEENVSREKFTSLLDGVVINNDKFSLHTLISESLTSWSEPEWGFPKGRRNYMEKDLDCAVREFTEETGYSRTDIEIVYNLTPFEEMFTGSNFKSYKHRYYVAQYIGDNKKLPQHQTSEVGELKWSTYEECLKRIRNYNLEKLDVLSRINTLLNDYSVYR